MSPHARSPRSSLATLLVAVFAALGAPIAAVGTPGAVADFDGDGKADAVVTAGAPGEPGTLGVRLTPAPGSAPGWVVNAVGSLPRGLAAADLDGDGLGDLAYLDERPAGALVVVRFGRGDGSFSAELPVIELAGVEALRAEDLDGDGDVDLRTVAPGAADAALINDGTGAFAVAAAGGPAPAASEGAGGGALLWRQMPDGQSGFGPSVRSSTVDREIADDFVLDAVVTRLVAFGGQGFPPPPPVALEGLEVRFYDVAPDGRPGEVVAEYLLAPDDPNLVYTPGNPGPFDVTLSPPFTATGHHFVGVQPVFESYWQRPSADRGATRHSHIWVKDDLAGGEWTVYEDVLGEHLTDVGFELYGTLTAPPVVTGLSTDETTRSGRVRIFGDNLGGTPNGGSVTIGGETAWISQWSDFSIHAYVPEGSVLGSADVVVTNAVGSGVPAVLGVAPRQPEGRVRWRFTVDGRFVSHRVGLGPDGTVYAHDNWGTLYALSPEGGLEWLLDLGDEGDEGPTVVGADGTVYVGVNPLGPDAQVVAVNPDGTVRWTFTTTNTQGLLAGPGIGPDGNVYGVMETPGIGAFALDPDDGTLLWNNEGDPVMNEHGQLGIEIAFGSDRFYVGFDERAVHPTALLFGFGLDGDQLFAVPRPDAGAQPVVGPDGTVYVRTWVGSAGIRLGAHDPDGTLRWLAFDSPTNVLSDPGVSADGSIYAVRNTNQLWSLRPDSSARWTVTTDGWIDRPIPSPDGRLILTSGFHLGDYGFFRAFDDQGGELWDETLPDDASGAWLVASAPARFDPSGDRAYVTAHPSFNLPDDDHCYLYSLDTRGDVSLFADGFESGDWSAWSAATP
ncbi:MAG: PQQ-binding-like beta-propeller repeat protein [Thermoanaerobaculia bacterium]